MIEVEKLSKQYRIGQQGPGAYRTLRDSLAGAATAPWRAIHARLGRVRHDATVNANSSRGTIWALKDISFDVPEGEVVGIIGHNGAGKSTLLKILSRVTEPTAGRVTMRGRLSSLLEVGTGFHHELTGRENVYLNGSILGMGRREIDRRFDAIVDFAEIEQFLDTPVKRYSSGMYVRLAFAVAAHLDPEILVIDEVLAVGDLAFQRKCMGRMQEVGRSGHTVLFVSHNMAAMEGLCDRGLMLERGQLAATGPIAEVVATYRRMAQGVSTPVTECMHNFGRPMFVAASLLDEFGNPTTFVPLGSEFHARLDWNVPGPMNSVRIDIGIDDLSGQRLLTLQTPASKVAVGRLVGPCQIHCRVDQFPLAPGNYTLRLAFVDNSVCQETVERACTFSVLDGDAFGEGRGFYRGLCVAPSQWQHTVADAVMDRHRN